AYTEGRELEAGSKRALEESCSRISSRRSSSLDCRRFTSRCGTASTASFWPAPSSSAAGCNSTSTLRTSRSRSCGRTSSSHRSSASCAARSTLCSSWSVCISDGSSADNLQPKPAPDQHSATCMLRAALREIKRRLPMTSAVDPKPMSRTSAVLYAIGLPLGLIALVFLPAGRIDWSPGWIFIAVLLVALGLSALLLARVNPVIFRARSRFQPGTEKWDLVLLSVILPAMVAEIPLATLDAGRMGWSDVPPSAVVIGYVLLVAGTAVTAWAQSVNPFFEPGVRIQKERAQRVIT